MKINEFSIVFIGGIHGVGKTIFSERASQMLKVPHFSASSLITEQRKAPAAINKRVQSVGENQNALITAIEANGIQSKQFLLDGHFCVFDSSDLINKVPLETFRTLAPIAVVVLFDDVNQIQERLEKRDKRKFNFELLNDLQKAELENAEEVCSLLKIPICSASASEHNKALQFAVGQFSKLKKQV
jgi:adenylate kinase